MVLRKNVLQEDDILCELYADTRSHISDHSDNESLDSDSESDVSATSSRKQLQSSVVVVTSDSETNTVVNRRNLTIEQVMCGVKLIKSQAMSLYLEPQV